MSINNVGSTTGISAYQNYASQTTKTTTTEEAVQNTSTGEETGVIYEHSSETENVTSQKTTYTSNTELVNRLKADAEQRTAQLRSLVEKLMLGQGDAYGKANDMWEFLASGDFTVDAATKAQAQADIAEDGYWGVDQTSSRIIDFATALTGGDPDKIEDMRDAFKKGYEKATETWGGKLPDISQKTYDAVMSKFDELAETAKAASTTEITE